MCTNHNRDLVTTISSEARCVFDYDIDAPGYVQVVDKKRNLHDVTLDSDMVLSFTRKPRCDGIAYTFSVLRIERLNHP